MLTQLRILNLGVIDDAEVEFGPGFTVVTGETGAGKTMVVSGLELLLGERAPARLIRHGADRAVVEGRISPSPLTVQAVTELGGTVEDDELLASRVITTSRSRAVLGGVQVPSTTVRTLLGDHITVHGQSEQIRLGSTERQREVLDAFAGPALATVLTSYRQHWNEYQATLAEREALVSAAQERAREQSMLEFGLAEINLVEPVSGEDNALHIEARRLQAVDDLRRGAHTAQVALVGDDEAYDDAPNALGLVNIARRALADLVEADPTLSSMAERITEANYLLADAATDLASYASALDADPTRLEWIAARLAALQGLTRKYGNTVAEVLAWAEQATARLIELDSSNERLAQLDHTIADLDAVLTEQATQLSVLRHDAAGRLAGLVEAELAALAMPKARLEFHVSSTERGPHGADAVTLLFSANPGSAPAPLAKVASGGELSRVRLALEVVLASGSEGHTFVFDEVDAGVGGAVALEIGRRLARLAQHAQVIVVTHLAQVAAFADRHYVVAKSDDGQVTTSGLVQVVGESRIDELARMMAGLDGTDAARAHAQELLETAHAAGIAAKAEAQ